MAFDLVVKNGWIVDGTGLPKRFGDVAVKDGKVVEMGRIDRIEGAKRVIDADGQIVAPGFLDIHTHLDAQVTWDPILTSSCYHGITTVVMGNCGYTMAPSRLEARDYLLSVLAKVEGMDLEAMRKGMRWEWESF